MTEKEKQNSNENKDEMIKTDILNDLKIIKLYEPPVISNSSNTETINKEPTDKIEPKFKDNISMNENIDLTKILKDCPKGTKFYTSVWGEASFERILERGFYTIGIDTLSGYKYLTKEGRYINADDAECILFPSKDQRDWSKFTAPWYKKNKFDPKTLKPFDKVLVRDSDIHMWKCNLFSHIIKNGSYPYQCSNVGYLFCIPYNDDTKHLVGTTEEAPEYYKYWED